MEISWWKSKLSWLLVKKLENRPYSEKIDGNVSIRKFYKNTNPEELVWHRDKEDRTIQVLNNSDWCVQVDNELPLPLRKGFSIFIPKGVYHRVLKGQTDLVVKVTKHS